MIQWLVDLVKSMTVNIQNNEYFPDAATINHISFEFTLFYIGVIMVFLLGLAFVFVKKIKSFAFFGG